MNCSTWNAETTIGELRISKKEGVITTGRKKYGKYSTLGKVIKKRLVDKGMTAAELADAVGTSPQYLNMILHGQRKGKKYIEKIKEILEIDIAA